MTDDMDKIGVKVFTWRMLFMVIGLLALKHYKVVIGAFVLVTLYFMFWNAVHAQ
jgi:hypothetical protein